MMLMLMTIVDSFVLVFVPFSVLECMLFKYFSRCLPFPVATASGSTVELAVQQGDANEPVLMGSKNAAGDEGTHAASAWLQPYWLPAGGVGCSGTGSDRLCSHSSPLLHSITPNFAAFVSLFVWRARSADLLPQVQGRDSQVEGL